MHRPLSCYLTVHRARVSRTVRGSVRWSSISSLNPSRSMELIKAGLYVWVIAALKGYLRVAPGANGPSQCAVRPVRLLAQLLRAGENPVFIAVVGVRARQSSRTSARRESNGTGLRDASVFMSPATPSTIARLR